MADLPSKKRFVAAQGALGPREQLEKAATAEEVDPAALLAVLLRTGAAGCDVLELSRRLIEAYGGNLGALVASDWRTLRATIAAHNREHPERKILGIGKVKVLELAAAFGLARRGLRHAEGALRDLDLRMDAASQAARLFRPLVLGDPQENFLVLLLDAGHHPLCEPLRVTRGTADRTPVHPREVFRKAIQWGAHSMIVAHNHPDGDPEPGEEDCELTRKLLAVARLHSIPILDHLVLGDAAANGGKGFVSIRARHPELFSNS